MTFKLQSRMVSGGLPEFPEFKKLELSDKEAVEKITSKYPPYSDFNFVSMWSWDTKGEMRLCQLNGNLVVRFTDYITGEPFYSFLGDKKVNETAEALFELSKKEGLEPKIRFAPENSVKELDENRFNVEEDRDNHDYIIPISLLKEYNTSHTRSKRRAVRSLLNEFKPEVRILNLSNAEDQNSVLSLAHSRSKTDEHTIENELMAISRFMKIQGEIHFLSLGIFIDSKMVGFIFSQFTDKKSATAHFWRADTKISQHLYAYLMQQKAKLLHQHGCEFLNIEQDLGIENLRKWKQSYSAEIFLKKYIITPK